MKPIALGVGIGLVLAAGLLWFAAEIVDGHEDIVF